MSKEQQQQQRHFSAPLLRVMPSSLISVYIDVYVPVHRLFVFEFKYYSFYLFVSSSLIKNKQQHK